MKVRPAGHFTDSGRENALSYPLRRTGVLLNMNWQRNLMKNVSERTGLVLESFS